MYINYCHGAESLLFQKCGTVYVKITYIVNDEGVRDGPASAETVAVGGLMCVPSKSPTAVAALSRRGRGRGLFYICKCVGAQATGPGSNYTSGNNDLSATGLRRGCD